MPKAMCISSQTLSQQTFFSGRPRKPNFDIFCFMSHTFSPIRQLLQSSFKNYSLTISCYLCCSVFLNCITASCPNWSPRHCLFSSISRIGRLSAGYSFASNFKNFNLPKNGDEVPLNTLLPMAAVAALTLLLLYYADLATAFCSVLGPPGTVLHQGFYPSCHFSQSLHSWDFLLTAQLSQFTSPANLVGPGLWNQVANVC